MLNPQVRGIFLIEEKKNSVTVASNRKAARRHCMTKEICSWPYCC